MTKHNAQILPSHASGSQVDSQSESQSIPQEDAVEQKLKEMDQQAIDSIGIMMEGYAPATSIAESTEQWDTEEIAESIALHTGRWLSYSIIFRELKKRGFSYGCVGVHTLCWLLKPKG